MAHSKARATSRSQGPFPNLGAGRGKRSLETRLKAWAINGYEITIIHVLQNCRIRPPKLTNHNLHMYYLRDKIEEIITTLLSNKKSQSPENDLHFSSWIAVGVGAAASSTDVGFKLNWTIFDVFAFKAGEEMPDVPIDAVTVWCLFSLESKIKEESFKKLVNCLS